MYMLWFKNYLWLNVFKPVYFFLTSLYFLNWFVYQLSKTGFYLWGVVKK